MCQKNSCRLITVILASVHFSLFVPVSSNPANAESDFGMLRNTFKAVSSKHELEELIKTEITSYYYENGQVDWDCLIQGFRAMGDEFKVVIIPNAGFEKADVIRFSVDNLTGIIHDARASSQKFPFYPQVSPEARA